MDRPPIHPITDRLSTLESQVKQIRDYYHVIIILFALITLLMLITCLVVWWLDRQYFKRANDYFEGYHAAWHAEHDGKPILPARTLEGPKEAATVEQPAVVLIEDPPSQADGPARHRHRAET